MTSLSPCCHRIKRKRPARGRRRGNADRALHRATIVGLRFRRPRRSPIHRYAQQWFESRWQTQARSCLHRRPPERDREQYAKSSRRYRAAPNVRVDRRCVAIRRSPRGVRLPGNYEDFTHAEPFHGRGLEDVSGGVHCANFQAIPATRGDGRFCLKVTGGVDVAELGPVDCTTDTTIMQDRAGFQLYGSGPSPCATHQNFRLTQLRTTGS